MLVTEQEAIATKWCPMVRLRWEKRTFSFNRSNPGPQGRFRNMVYRMFWRPAIRRLNRSNARDIAVWRARRARSRASMDRLLPDAMLSGVARGEYHALPRGALCTVADHRGHHPLSASRSSNSQSRIQANAWA